MVAKLVFFVESLSARHAFMLTFVLVHVASETVRPMELLSAD
jgi:hypothetical protein